MKTTAVPPPPQHVDTAYLLVCEPGTSRVVELRGERRMTIGRSPECAIVLDDPSASRVHAELVVGRGRVELEDRGSQNGTRVDGVRVDRILLTSGSVVEIGATTLVLHTTSKPRAAQVREDVDAFRSSVERELDRTRVSKRGFVVIAFRCEDSDRANTLLENVLRPYDVVVHSGPDVLLLCPETEPDEPSERELRSVLGALGTHVGVAACPQDTLDGARLIALARERAGVVVPPSPSTARFVAGALEIVAAESATLQLYALVERLARSDIPLLVRGETGAGKEVVAAAIHYWSKRAQGPFVSINCAALPDDLVESELFGHERGAFSGAVAAKPGLFEAASGGTLFLDEVGDLPLATQAKLLRALETKRITRVGSVTEREVDVRLVAATNRDLEHAILEEQFRRDLYFRISGGVLMIPPLRDRPQELVLLARRFLAEACRSLDRTPMTLSNGALVELAGHSWPGNVRELKHVIDYIAAATAETIVEAKHVRDRLGTTAPRKPEKVESAPAEPLRDQIERLEREQIEEAMRLHGGHQANAANSLGMPLRTFVNKLKRYNLRKS